MSCPAAEPATERRPRAAWAALVALVPLAVYVATLTPAVLDDGPADLARQAYTLGLAYAPGYALNGMVGKAVTTRVPFGPKAWRANLVGALAATAGVMLGYAILRRRAVARVPAVVAVWVLAFSPVFWSEALTINAFAMTVAFAMATVLLFITWAARRELWRLGAASAVFGLGLSSHPSFVLYAPAVGLFIVATLWREGWQRVLAGLGIAAVAGLAGCLPCLLYTLRYLLQEGPADRVLPRLVVLLTAAEGRSDWGTYVTLAFWRGQAARLGLHGARTFAQFSVGGIVLAAVGLVALWRRRKVLLLLLAVGYAMQTAFATTIGNWHHFDVYRFVPYALLALVMGVGLGAVWRWSATPLRPWALCGVVVALTLGPPYAMLSRVKAAEAPALSAQMPFRAAFARAVEADATVALEQAPPGAVVAASWMRFATLRFVQQVEGVGGEVGLVWMRGGLGPMRRQLGALAATRRVLCYVRPGHAPVLESQCAALRARRVLLGHVHELRESPSPMRR